MGRPSRGDEPDTSQPLYLRRIRLDNGGYDAGGAYWGHDRPLFACMDHTGAFYETLRAYDRNAAKNQIRAVYPGAWFYGEKKPEMRA